MFNKNKFKKGVSLVTVLVLMMVATIATTATYKWLSSVGFTSAERMAIAAAKQASHAGLENARSWMTYHANDVGAIVRQYYDNGKKPVALTNLVRSANGSGMIYSVWLTGVQASGASYKFTVVSTGTAQNDAKYSETAVLNVSGLYKVKVPIKTKKKALNYGYSYFGGSTSSTDGVKNTSMMVNGNWNGNPTGVEQGFIVTGNVELSGSDMALGKYSCVGGTFSAENNGVKASGDLYVKGRASKIAGTIGGNAVFDQSIHMSNSGQGLTVNGDLTANGRIHIDDQKKTTIGGNLCFGKEGSIDNYQNIQNNSRFNAMKNVKILNTKTNWWEGPALSLANFSDDRLRREKNIDEIRSNLILGGEGYSIYFEHAEFCRDINYKYADCWWRPPTTVIFNGNKPFTSYANKVNSVTADIDCKVTIVDYCNDILGEKTNGCDKASYKIDDMITTAYDAFSKLGEKVPCANITPDGHDYDMNQLSACYAQTKSNPNLMYHGYLVVKIKGGNNTIFRNPRGKLKGNFIFYADDRIGNSKFPPTENDANVFVYLAKGGDEINTTNDGGAHNYFVYSKENIRALQNNAPDRTWSGSFYMEAEGCAKIERMVSANQYLKYNSTLVQNLIDSAVICGFDEKGSCGNVTQGSDDSGNTEGENLVEGYDSYYVATAPLLSISLESQRRNKEVVYDYTLDSARYTTVKPSIVVLPRIIYLSDAPAGKLKDYYKVLNLNGATETFTASNTVCSPALETVDELYSGVKLTEPLYKCTYTSKKTDYGSVPFWVVTDGASESKSEVSFTKSDSRIYGGGVATSVEVSVDAKQAAPVSVFVKVTKVPDGWELKPAGLPLNELNDGSQSDDPDAKTYIVTLQPGTVTPLFTVSAEDGAANNQMYFTITSVGANARIGQYPNHSVWLTGAVDVHRIDIPKTGFCDESNHKSIDGVLCTDIVSRPDCEGSILASASGEWVVPNCDGASTIDNNAHWQCDLSGVKELHLRKATVSPYCDVFVHDSSITKVEDGKDYTFYASYKAKKYNYKLVLEGANASTVMANEIECTAKDTCRFSAFAGEQITLVANQKGGEQLMHWKFAPIDNPLAAVSDEVSDPKGRPFIAVGDTLIIADFNEGENHCFYSDFKNTGIWCEKNAGTDDCIDKCTISKKQTSCNTATGGTRVTSNWLVPRTNDGQDFKKPEKDGEDFLYYKSPKSSDNGNSTITYLLNRTQAGGHGSLMARFKTCPLEGKNTNLNSGFIIRSSENSDEYANLQIFGVENGGLYTMTARICKGDGTGIKNVNVGGCETKSFSMQIPSDVFVNNVFNVDVDVSSDEAVVDLSYKKNENWTHSIVKLNVPVAATRDQYVGLSLAEDCFKVMNIGWESSDWGADSCFDVPKIGCSFSATYLGGILPVNEDVKPWVGTSSWFSDPTDANQLRKGCSMSYHYNGCDLSSSYSTNTCQTWLDGTTHCGSCKADSDGPYYVSGVNANKLSGEEFNFSYVGLHGISKTYEYDGGTIYGSVRDASVVVDCSGSGGNGQVYETSCGRFMVGNITECSQNLSLKTSSCENQTTCAFRMQGGSVNLRSSSLMGRISGLPDGDDTNIPTISVTMTDVNGLSSQEFIISGNGTFSRDVNLMADMQDFDPEKIASIVFVSEYSFTLESFSSNCPNSVGVYGCEATFSGDHIDVKSSVTNASSAKCKVEGLDNTYKLAETDCPADGSFQVPAIDLLKTLYESGDDQMDLRFKVTATSKDNYTAIDTCVTPTMTVYRSDMQCNMSATTVAAGQSLPAINYLITNCPEAGCAVTATVGSNDPVKLVYTGNGQYRSWTPSGNATAGEYTYKLEYSGISCTGKVTVTGAGTNGTAKNCAIDEKQKLFTADINLTSPKNTLTLSYMDKMGNVIKSVNKDGKKPDKKYSQVIGDLDPGNYTLALSVNGSAVCSVPYTVESTEQSPEDGSSVSCKIENGRFLVSSNPSQYDRYVSINRNTNGSTYGDYVAGDTWLAGSTLDLNAYLPSDPGTYTYNFWYSGKVLCSVTVEVGAGE